MVESGEVRRIGDRPDVGFGLSALGSGWARMPLDPATRMVEP
jgi:hypothetical protein